MKKGFTLIELLAVIIILAVIALITTPIVLDVVENAKEKSRISSVNSLLDATRLYMSEAMLDDSIDLSGNLLDIINNRVKGTKPSEGEIKINGNDIGIAVKIDGYCYIKDYTSNEIKKTNDSDCVIYKVVEATCYGKTNVVSGFEINYDGCVANLNSVFDTEYTEEEIKKVCKNEAKIDDVCYIDRYINAILISGEDMSVFVDNNIVNLKYDSVCKTCFEYKKNLAYKINYSSCMNSALAEEYDTEDLKKFCSGEKASVDGEEYSVDELISENNEMMYILYMYGVIDIEETDAVITDYNCYEGNELGMPTVTNLITPTSINGLKIVNIDELAFKEKGLTNITISDGVKTIGPNAFYNNPYETVDISSTVENISDYAFGKDTLIENQIINNHTNKKFDWSSITGSNTSNQVFSQGEVIHQYGNIIVNSDSDFEYEKVAVYEMEYDECVKSFSWLDVSLCSEEGFYGINYQDFIEYFDELGALSKSANVNITYKEEYKITNYFGDKNVVIPASIDGIPVTKIATAAFYGKGITSVDFSQAVNLEKINSAAFSDNQISGELDFSKTRLKKIIGVEMGVFSNNQITSIKLPSSIATIGGDAFSDNQISGELDLSNLVNLIYISGFEDNQITSVKLPSSVTGIGSSAFEGNQIKDELDLSVYSNLITIGENAFDNNQITSIKLPNGITTIGSEAFSNNQISGELDLSNLTNLTVIKSYAFANNQITSVKLPSSVTEIGSYAFYNNQISGELDISNLQKLTKIYSYAFANNSDLKAIKIYNGSIEIGTDETVNWNGSATIAWKMCGSYDNENYVCYCNTSDPLSPCYPCDPNDSASSCFVCSPADPDNPCYCNPDDPASYCYVCDSSDPASECYDSSLEATE